jgi:hypothetical protein
MIRKLGALVLILGLAEYEILAQSTSGDIGSIFEELQGYQQREKEEKAQAASELAQKKVNACINLPSMPINLLERIANAHSVHPDSIRINESPHLTATGNCEVSVYLPVGACRYIINFSNDFVPIAYGLSYHGRNINCGLNARVKL